jgi:tRNA-dihydrouridine synthase B
VSAKWPDHYRVGTYEIKPNVHLAPMSGVTDYSFRRLIAELAPAGVGLTASEFVSEESLVQKSPVAKAMMRKTPGNKPFCVQIFGSEPHKLRQGALWVQELGADLLELNCGCPAPKVVRRGGGSGLLRDLPLLQQILRELRSVCQIPLMLKVRIGWDHEEINVLETLRIAEGEGVEVFTVHGRTRMQGYGGLAHWDWITRVCQQAKIPVIGNGDVRTAMQLPELFVKSGVQGVSIGRAAMVYPWVFREVQELWAGQPITPVTGCDVSWFLNRYLEILQEDEFPIFRRLGKIKMLISRMMRALADPTALEMRSKLLRMHDLAAMQPIWEDYLTALGCAPCFHLENASVLNAKD